MKPSRIIYLILILCSFTGFVSAQVMITDIGCDRGSAMYTQKIGTTNFWGTLYDVYYSGKSYPIDPNNTSACNSINKNTVITGKTVNGQSTCWVASSVPPTNSSSGVTWGTFSQYTLKDCTQNVPLDTNTWVLLLGTALLGSYAIKGLPRATN